MRFPQWNAGGGRRVVLVVALISLIFTAGAVASCSGSGSAPHTAPRQNTSPADYDWTAPQRHVPDPATLAIGVTHTQYTIGNWSDPAANASARAVLTGTATYQNQHIFGWGALNPEPSPGQFDWTSLDKRINLIRATGGTPVITLCCAPDWMKGGEPGETDWTKLEQAPTPDHYADYATLAVEVARRYPDVRRFQVWNELKGFWNKQLNRWDYEAYTDFYNVVYDALKSYDSTLAVGGPYVVVDLWARSSAGGHPSALTGDCGTVDQRSLDVLTYWLAHAHGADFIAVDASSRTRDDGTVTSSTVSAAVFGAITRWIRQRTTLPVWWSEFHVGRADAAGQPKLMATATAALLGMVGAQASAAFVWQPEADPGTVEKRPLALWTSTADAAGGEPLPYGDTLARVQELLADRAAPDPVSWPSADVGVLRGHSSALLVHSADGTVDIEVGGQVVHLGPYEVRYLAIAQDAPITAFGTPGDVGPTSLDRCLGPLATPQLSHGRAISE
jgi:hypothetical protein